LLTILFIVKFENKLTNHKPERNLKMRLFSRCFLLFSLFISANLYADPTEEGTIDFDALATQCYTLAVKLDSLSLAQNSKICTKNLDGLNVYYAGSYITFRWLNKAIEVLTAAIIQINYAYDINCYYPNDIKTIIERLTTIRNQLYASQQQD